MRVLAFALAALGLAVPVTGGARGPSCPHDPSLGSVRFIRAGQTHVVSLATCSDRAVGRSRPAARQPLRTADGRYAASVRSTGSGRSAKQTIWVTDERTHSGHAVASETQYYRRIGPGDTPGPIELLGWSTDDRWIFFTIDPGGSGSIAADGLILRAVSAAGGKVSKLGVALTYPDYLAWCGGRLVFIGGGDRVAVHAKRLIAASPPAWRPRPLWNDRRRSFGSLACAPDQRAVAVLSQRSSADAGFFSTRWRLWRVSLDGSHQLVDTPALGSADESPQWSRNGRSILFVRERNGYGQLMLSRTGHIVGPFASLGFNLGYYGHHDWGLHWSAGSP